MRLNARGHLRRDDSSRVGLRNDLADANLACSDDGAVYAGAILVHANNSLHHFRISFGCVRVQIDHHTSFVPHRYSDGWPVVSLTKHQCPAHPSVFLKRFTAICFDRDVWPESAKVNVSTGFARHAIDRAEANHRNAGIVKDAIPEVHQFDGAAIPARNFLA